MARPTTAFIDSQALLHNALQAKQVAPDSRVFAVVKANAYGHGLLQIAQLLQPLVDAFAVASIEEAVYLRERAISKPILLLEGVFEPDELSLCSQLELSLVVHNSAQLDMLSGVRLAVPVKTWLKVDTGMHRIGFPTTSIKHVLQTLMNSDSVATNVGLISHFANADDHKHPLNQQQIGLFRQIIDEYQFIGDCSLANSAAILTMPASHYQWVRAGLMLYGASPMPGLNAAALNLKPVMTLQTRLIAKLNCRRGDSIGYGSSWTCPEDMPVGVAAIGYGDGYPRHLPTGTPILVNDQQTQLIGRVSMDMISVDLRPCCNAEIGDPVILWGGNLPVEIIAEHADTIPYTLLCGITNRVRRQILPHALNVPPADNIGTLQSSAQL